MPTVQRTLTVTFSNGKKLELQGKVDAELDKKLRSASAAELSESAASKLTDKIFGNSVLGAGEQLAATALSAACMVGRSVRAVEYSGVDKSKDFVRALGLAKHASGSVREQINDALYSTSGKGTATLLQILAGEVVVDPEKPTATVEPRSSRPALPKKEWTVLVYFSADNELAPYGLGDLKEMKNGFAKISSFANVVVLFDNPLATGPTPGLSEESASPAQVLLLEHNKSARSDAVKLRPVQVDGATRLGKLINKTDGYLNLASGDTLRAAREFAASFAPSSHTMLVLSGHGEGALGSMTDDSSPDPDDLLRPHELRSALTASAKPVDVLAFDACTMQDAATAELADAVGAKLLVASEESEPQRGWQWKKFFESMARAHQRNGTLGPADISRSAVDTYNGYTMSCVDAVKTREIWSGLDDLGRLLRAAGGRDNTAIDDAIQNVERYDEGGDTVDLIDFCKQLMQGFERSSEVYRAARDLASTVEASVLRHTSTASRAAHDYGNSHGLSIYLPLDADAVDPKQAGRVTGEPAASWVAFLKGE